MSTQKLLAPIQVIIENSEIEENAEGSKVRAAALSAQRVEIPTVLGASLTNLFLNAIDDDGTLTGLTSTQSTFYSDYLVPLFATHTAAKFVYVSHYNLSSTGVKVIEGKNTTSATDKAVEMIYKQRLNEANYYATRAKEFICDPANYADLGSIYHGANQNIHPSNNTPKGSIYFPED